MAAPITQAVGTPTNTNKSVNSRTNVNSNSQVKGENGFCILASLYNTASDSFIQNYQAIVFDAVTNTHVTHQAEVSSYAIEASSKTSSSNSSTDQDNSKSSEVSDHVQIKNTKIDISGVISETPIQLKKDLLYSGQPKGDRVSQAITYLTKIMEARQPITLLTEHKVFKDVVLIGVDYAYKSEYAMQFDLNFEQVRLVKGATVNAIAVKTASTLNTGKQVKKAVYKPTSADLEQRIQNQAGGSNNKTG